MYAELRRELETLEEILSNLGDSLDIAGKEQKIAELEKQMAAPGFWEDAARAQPVAQQLAALRNTLSEYERLRHEYEELAVLLDLAEEEGDEGLLAELAADTRRLAQGVAALEMAVLLSGPYDAASAIVTLHAGAGGTDAQDWVAMLLRMYTRWAEERGYQVQVLDLLAGDEAGLKSVTFEVDGENAYGYLRAERGVHRLVRISPFDASGRRHTSFASVDVLPAVSGETEVELKPEDLRIDTFRASGAGGQHVNKTESAVRITHLPTGVTVTCQSERSQAANKASALEILKARLLDLKLKEQEVELAKLRGEQREIAWGSQIRSYVLNPYSMVKDHRTGLERGDVQAVLDGEIDDFIHAFLQAEAKKQSAATAAAGNRGG
ncbi:MAG: peptide chain release factor 2 [Bacillota bacterium]|nr:peptide chain release factor 2 [Thermoanaerobacteraceae bacterium]